MDVSPLAGLCSCPRVTATCAQSPANWLRMTRVGSSPEEKNSRLGMCVALLTVSAPVRRIGHNCCAHRAISIHREMRGGSRIWVNPTFMIVGRHFRSTPTNRHPQSRAACLKRATSRLMQCSNTLCYSITWSAWAPSDCGLSGRAPSQSYY
jgi:hypothetical protein